jgi:hypothetical protein
LSEDCYHYLPLSPNHIQLLSNVDYDSNGCIQASLENFPLEPTPLYIALSYTWGRPIPIYADDDEETREAKEACSGERNGYITIDGKRFAVTQNLVDYLEIHVEIFRDDDASLPMWIDAICINQEDVSEKYVQVGQMHEVYRGASCVRAWLGPHDRWPGHVLEFIDRIATLTLPGSKWEFGVGHLASDAFEVSLSPMIRSQAHWEAAFRFFSRTWFRRCWVVQGDLGDKGINKAVGCNRRHKIFGPSPYSTYQRVKKTQYLVLRDDSAGWVVENPDGSEYTVDFRQSPRSDHRRPI